MPSALRFRFLVVVCFSMSALTSFARAAHAQVPDAEARPTRGVHVAGGARAGDADATSLASNPAQLALLPAGGVSLAEDFGGRAALLAGRGAGLFAAAPALHGGLGL